MPAACQRGTSWVGSGLKAYLLKRTSRVNDTAVYLARIEVFEHYYTESQSSSLFNKHFSGDNHLSIWYAHLLDLNLIQLLPSLISVLECLVNLDIQREYVNGWWGKMQVVEVGPMLKFWRDGGGGSLKKVTQWGWVPLDVAQPSPPAFWFLSSQSLHLVFLHFNQWGGVHRQRPSVTCHYYFLSPSPTHICEPSSNII